MFDRDDYLPPKLLQIIGLVLLIAQGVFWAFTGQSQTLFIGPSLALIFIGQYQETVRALKRPDREPSPPPIAPAEPSPERET
jgi:hypothetical protein